MKRTLHKTRCVCFFVFVFFMLVDGISAAPKFIGTLKEFTGEVMIKNSGSWVKAKKALRLFSGAKIVTRNGNATIVYDDGATMFVDSFSSIRTIDQLQQTASVFDEQINIRRNRIMIGRTKYEEQPIKGRQTRIELPTAVAALRGTGGWFGAKNNLDSQGKLYEGNMDTSGAFQESLPDDPNEQEALGSNTWQSSIEASGEPRNSLKNVNDTHAEAQTFGSNNDPDVKKMVSDTTFAAQTAQQSIEEKNQKIEKAERAIKSADEQIKKAPPGSLQQETNQAVKQANENYIAAAKQSGKTDLSIAEESLKEMIRALLLPPGQWSRINRQWMLRIMPYRYSIKLLSCPIPPRIIFRFKRQPPLQNRHNVP